MNVKIITELTGELQFDMSEKEALQLIGAAQKSSLMSAAEKVVQTADNPSEVKLEKPVSKVERMFGDYHSRIPVQSVMPALRKPLQEGVYKGFLMIQCEDCWKVRGFYAKNPQSIYYCPCGCQTKLKGLRPMFPKCLKCGQTFKYMTNIADNDLTYNCLNCGSPIDLELNKNGSAFVTVGGHSF